MEISVTESFITVWWKKAQQPMHDETEPCKNCYCKILGDSISAIKSIVFPTLKKCTLSLESTAWQLITTEKNSKLLWLKVDLAIFFKPLRVNYREINQVTSKYQIDFLEKFASLGTKFQLKLAILNFWTKNHHRILHIQISLGPKF